MIKIIFRIFRLKNLLFIALIQILLRVFIIKPILASYNLQPLFSSINFALLVIATVLIAAAGYLINDYFDVDVDKFNSKKNYIEQGISKRTAMAIYLIMNALALVLATYISFEADFYKLLFIFIIIEGLLWFYSTSYKKYFLIGNAIVALLSALVPLILIPYEIIPQYNINTEKLIELRQNLDLIIYWIIGFSVFAFILTLIREIIKDIEDFQGDISQNYSTIPIILGIKNTKIILILLFMSVIATIGYVFFTYINDNYSLIYILIFITLPILFAIFKLLKAKVKKDYHFLSTLTKIIMLTGVLYSIVASLKF